MLAFVQIGAFIGPLCVVPGIIFWTKVTPHESKTFWMKLCQKDPASHGLGGVDCQGEGLLATSEPPVFSVCTKSWELRILTQVSRNVGLVIGPLIFTVLKLAVTGDGERVSPRSMMAWINVFLLWMGMTNQNTIKRALLGQDIADFSATGDSKPEDLPDSQREQMVWHMIWYAVERPFTLAAVEVSTLMMLEVYYGWDPYWTGLCFTGVCSVGILMSAFTTAPWQRSRTESWVFMIAAASSILGCFVLFDIAATPGWFLLVADCIIYTGATVANGIAEGWASRAAKEGTRFSNTDYRVRQLYHYSPIVGRFLVDYGGRNTYAACQLVAFPPPAPLLPTRTVYRTCTLIWNQNARKLEAAEKAKQSNDKLLSVPEPTDEESTVLSLEEQALEDQPSTDGTVSQR
eukprot:g24760.t1